MPRDALLALATGALLERGIRNGAQEARWLLDHVAGDSTSAPVPPETEARFRALLQRRLAGEPLQYVMASTEFHGLDFSVGPGVLIPRPETERLVDFALARYPGHHGICDLCTGSGAIILALAHALPDVEPTVGIDLSPEALAYARRNRESLGLHRVGLIEGDLFAPIPDDIQFGLVTANPPYVSAEEYAQLPGDVADWEPRLALFAEDRGLALIQRIANSTPPRLVPGGWLLCEIGCEQGEATRTIFRDAGFAHVEILQDYCQRDRVVAARKGGEGRGNGIVE
jgi:release factor glutamine methyltransferase